jgi:hypothetical protein
MDRRTFAAAVVATVAMAACVFASSASAYHPSESPNANDPTHQCNEANVDAVLFMPDGEVWVCRYDPIADDYFWEPAAPTTLPGDGTAYKDQYVSSPDGITQRITSRVEWINNVLYSGTDTFFRQPVTSPFNVTGTNMGIYSRVYAWNGSAWSVCKNSGWVFGTSAQSPGWVHTWNWGRAPCGTAWYAAVAWVERYHPETSSWVLENAGSPVDTSAGGTSLGSGAQNGQVWDAAPGDEGKKPPKPAKDKIKLTKSDAPPPAPPGS